MDADWIEKALAQAGHKCVRVKRVLARATGCVLNTMLHAFCLLRGRW